MIYEFPDESAPIRQGDIFVGLPRVDISLEKIVIAAEDGVQGLVGRELIELRNSYQEIGLYDEYASSNWMSRYHTNQILDWYAELLGHIFWYELRFKKRSFGRGAILKLKNKPENFDEERDGLLLWFAIRQKTRRTSFANRVFQTLSSIEGNPFVSCYVAGLSDEDIARFFVPPPIGD